MKILLINPPQIPLKDFNFTTAHRRGYPAYPPMGLGYLTAEVKDSKLHEVELYDCHLEVMLRIMEDKAVDNTSIFYDYLENKLKTCGDVDVIGISIMFTCLFENLVNCLDRIREIHPNAVIVVGGAHASMSPKSLYKLNNIDYILAYESEITFVQFLNHLEAEKKAGRPLRTAVRESLAGSATTEIKMKREEFDIDRTHTITDKADEATLAAVENNKLFAEIQGLHYRNAEGKFCSIPFQTRIAELDKRSWPDWNSLGITKYYKTGRFGGAYTLGDTEKPFAPLLTARGCRGECSFCTVHVLMGRNVRMRSDHNVVDEIEYLNKNFGVKFFEILDDDFTFSTKRSMAICNEIVRRKLDITWTAKNGLIACSLNRELIQAMVESGCRYIQIGVESGSKEMLQWIRKPMTIPKLLMVREILRDFPQIYLAGYFIIGFPNETKKMMRDTYNLAKDLALDWSAITMAQPLPNSRMYETFVTEGLIKEDELNYGDLTFFHNTIGNKYCTMREILDMWYEFNIGINFVNNPNLNGGNIDRAIRDFSHVGYEVAPGHAMSIYCLGKAYQKKGDEIKAQQLFAEVQAIVNKDAEWQKWFRRFQIKEIVTQASGSEDSFHDVLKLAMPN